MTRLESAAWPLVFGSASVFVLAIVLNRLPWQAAFAAVAVAVACWAWCGPVVVGAALGVIAWLCVTGFDVYRFGDIGIAGSGDVVRGTALVALGVVAGSVHAVLAAMRSHRRADPVWSPSMRPILRRLAVGPRGCVPTRIQALVPTSNKGANEMADLAYVVLTLAIFVLFGLVVKAVERL